MRIAAALAAVLLCTPAVAQGPPDRAAVVRAKLAELKLTGTWLGQELRPTGPPGPHGALTHRLMIVKPRIGGALLEVAQVHSPANFPPIKILDILGFDAAQRRYYFERHSSEGHYATFYGPRTKQGRLLLTLALPRVEAEAAKTVEFEGDGKDHLLLERFVGPADRRICLCRVYMHRKGVAPRWWQKAGGWLGTDGKRGARRFRTAEQWAAFRKTTKQLRAPKGVKGIESFPLPDHDFAKGELLLLTSPSIIHHFRLHSVDARSVSVEVLDPDKRERMMSRPSGVGNFLLLQIDKPAKDFAVAWR